MSTSIPVLNRNTQLPPLLLPASWPLERCDPFGKRRRQVRLEGDGLEGLAFVATKRARLDAAVRPLTAESSRSRSASPACATATSATTAAAAAVASAPASAPVSPRSERGSPRSERSERSSKRQRIGPSCDGCRLKKIKCDARVEVLYQGPAVTRLVSDKLHQVVSREQVLAHLPIDIPSHCDDSGDESASGSSSDDSHTHPHTAHRTRAHSILVKHIDKIILFRPCTSCAKRRASVEGLDLHAHAHTHSPAIGGPMEDHPAGGCVFSKGFTRADINVFAKITKRVGPRAVQDMTLQDYRDAGFE